MYHENLTKFARTDSRVSTYEIYLLLPNYIQVHAHLEYGISVNPAWEIKYLSNMKTSGSVIYTSSHL